MSKVCPSATLPTKWKLCRGSAHLHGHSASATLFFWNCRLWQAGYEKCGCSAWKLTPPYQLYRRDVGAKVSAPVSPCAGCFRRLLANSVFPEDVSSGSCSKNDNASGKNLGTKRHCPGSGSTHTQGPRVVTHAGMYIDPGLTGCRHQAVLADKGFAGLVLGFPKLKHQVCEDDEDILLVSPDGTLLTSSESH